MKTKEIKESRHEYHCLKADVPKFDVLVSAGSSIGRMGRPRRLQAELFIIFHERGKLFDYLFR